MTETPDHVRRQHDEHDEHDEHNEPAVVHPRLAAWVTSARDQALVETSATAETIYAGWLRRRGQRRLWMGSAAAAVAVATGMLLVLTPGAPAGEIPGVHEATTAASVSPTPTPERGSKHEPGPSADTQTPPAQEIPLAKQVNIKTIGEAPPPEILGSWVVALAEGQYTVEVENGGPTPLLVGLGERTLELSHGAIHVDASGAIAVVRLRSGVAAWIQADGGRDPLVVQSLEPLANPTTPKSQDEGPATLARRAESLMRKGDTTRAIALLQTLVRRYPQAAASRSALLDLGRLLTRAGRTDEARCAYLVFTRRWPAGAMRADVERRLEALGNGPTCRGLKPR